MAGSSADFQGSPQNNYNDSNSSVAALFAETLFVCTKFAQAFTFVCTKPSRPTVAAAEAGLASLLARPHREFAVPTTTPTFLPPSVTPLCAIAPAWLCTLRVCVRGGICRGRPHQTARSPDRQTDTQ